MKLRKYYNKNLEPFYILHLPGSSNDCNQDMLDECAERKITMHKDISVISLMNERFWHTSPLVKQCELSGIHIYNDAYHEQYWSNILKLQKIQTSLDQVSTKYVLFLDGRDVGFVNDIDETFLEKYKSFNTPLVYNGTESNFPMNGIYEPLEWLLNDKNKNKFLNAGVCIGEVQAMKEFYKKALDIAMQATPNNKKIFSEQYYIRLTRVLNPEYVSVDSDCKLFASTHGAQSVERKDNQIILY